MVLTNLSALGSAQWCLSQGFVRRRPWCLVTCCAPAEPHQGKPQPLALCLDPPAPCCMLGCLEQGSPAPETSSSSCAFRGCLGFVPQFTSFTLLHQCRKAECCRQKVSLPMGNLCEMGGTTAWRSFWFSKDQTASWISKSAFTIDFLWQMKLKLLFADRNLQLLLCQELSLYLARCLSSGYLSWELLCFFFLRFKPPKAPLSSLCPATTSPPEAVHLSQLLASLSFCRTWILPALHFADSKESDL